MVTAVICDGMVKQFLLVCGIMGCPVSIEKTEWASLCLTFLGILLNGCTLTLSVPTEKMPQNFMLDYAIQKRKLTIKEVQQMTGLLNFLNKAIVPVRAFTRAMYSKLATKNRKTGQILKQHHHIGLNKDFALDCKVWQIFLRNVTNVNLCRPFIDSLEQNSYQLTSFHSDASK